MCGIIYRWIYDDIAVVSRSNSLVFIRISPPSRVVYPPFLSKFFPATFRWRKAELAMTLPARRCCSHFQFNLIAVKWSIICSFKTNQQSWACESWRADIETGISILLQPAVRSFELSRSRSVVKNSFLCINFLHKFSDVDAVECQLIAIKATRGSQSLVTKELLQT